MSLNKILLVDDDTDLLRLLSMRLRAAGYALQTAENGKQALGLLATFQPNLIITDLRMEGMDGMALFDAVHEQFPSLPVIILTAHGSIPDAVDATRKGIFSYLTKPFDSQQLLKEIEAALSQGYVKNEPTGSADDEWRSAIVTRSPRMEELLSQARRIAQSEASILIQSASGTGKELLAEAIHKSSPRKSKPFLPINCAAIPENLLESELFGHRKGAFTGADRDHTGLFQDADGGTVFLDEIGDMPLDFQVKLLRVLQERKVRPVGASNAIPVDVRIIAATNINLETAVEDGDFREDLYYRLNVVMLELPSLADRREDIPLLANHFLAQMQRQAGQTNARSFSPAAMALLLAAPWPGNIRQLQNVVEQVVVLSTTPVIPENLVRKALRGKTGEVVPLAEAQNRFEHEYLVSILQMTHGNVTHAARLARRNRTEFYKLLHRHQLNPELFRRVQT